MKFNMLRKRMLIALLIATMGMCVTPAKVYAEDIEVEENGPSMNDDEEESEEVSQTDNQESVEGNKENEKKTKDNNLSQEYEVEEQKETSTKSQLIAKRWPINDLKEKSISGSYTIPANTTRFEVFYNKDAKAPEITFQTTSGFIYKTSQDVYTDPVMGSRYETRRNNPVNDYSDMAYMVIYITKPSDPGKLLFSTLNDASFFTLNGAISA